MVEAIRVLRPVASPGSPMILGSLLQHVRSQVAELTMQTRYDLLLANESDGLDHLPPELRRGPFISLLLSWPLTAQASASLFQTPPALSCSSMVYIRVGQRQSALLDEAVAAIDFLEALSHGEVAGERELRSDAATLEAVMRVINEERRDAARSPAGPMAKNAMELDEADLRPSRDFVDRLWSAVFSRCATASCLVAATQQVLKELGSGALAPFVRKENGCEMAQVVRSAIRISQLRYGGLATASELRRLLAAWEEQALRLMEPAEVIPLVYSMGVECLRKDFAHIITSGGCVKPPDLAFFTDASDAQVERLRSLREIAELALICTKYRLYSDTARQLVLMALEHYREKSSTPVFGAALNNSSGARLLQTFPLLDPACVHITCGDSLIRAERQPRVRGWAPSEDCPFEYHISIVDRYRYA